MQAARHSQSIENTVFILAIAPHLQQNDDHSADEPFHCAKRSIHGICRGFNGGGEFQKA